MPNRHAATEKSAQPAAPLTAAVLKRAQVLPLEFFSRDPVTVGRELLGKLLVRREGRTLLAGRVVEDEAYLGVEDPAGHAYVYFIYGNHYCLNVSCMPEGYAGCVLLRAMEAVFGLAAMARARGLELTATPRPTQLRLIASGPGRMSQAPGDRK